MTTNLLRSHAERVRRILVAASVVATVLALATGCSNGCATDSVPYPPALTLDASSWFASNPDSAVQVCLNASCNTVTSEQASTRKGLVTIRQTAVGQDAVAKVVVSRGAQILENVSHTVIMKQNPCISMRCGCLSQGSSAAPLQLDATGHVTSG